MKILSIEVISIEIRTKQCDRNRNVLNFAHITAAKIEFLRKVKFLYGIIEETTICFISKLLTIIYL